MIEKKVKEGIKTTEFWVTLLVAVVAVVFSFGVIDEDAQLALNALVVAAAPVVAYILSRALVKKE